MEGLRGACVSPPEVSGADAEPVAANLEEDAACFWWTRGWRCLKKCVPVDFWKEVVQLLKLAGPVVRLQNIAAPCFVEAHNCCFPSDKIQVFLDLTLYLWKPFECNLQ